jgi:hypothetical protein
VTNVLSITYTTWSSEGLFTVSQSVGSNSFTTIGSFPTMRLSTGSYVGNGTDNRQITGAGALCVTRAGAQEAMPTLAEIERLLKHE